MRTCFPRTACKNTKAEGDCVSFGSLNPNIVHQMFESSDSDNPSPVEVKLCLHCGQPQKQYSWGFRCPPCFLAYKRQWKEENKERLAKKNREYAQKNRERIALWAKKRRKENPELSKQKTAEYNKRWREKNPEKYQQWVELAKTKYSETARRWREANKEKTEATQLRWRQSPQEKAATAARSNARRARLAKAEGVVSAEETKHLLSTATSCAYCQKVFSPDRPDWPTVDHITPLSKGGRHTADNLAICCFSCNSIKKNYSLEEFFTRLQKSRGL